MVTCVAAAGGGGGGGSWALNFGVLEAGEEELIRSSLCYSITIFLF